jgi:ATP-dependent helicase HrpA
MCRAEYLNYLRIREWQELESQLRQVAKQIKLDVGRPADEIDGDGVHQALLSGLLSHLGLRDPERRDYLGARNTRFSIFPGSGLFKKQPQLVMSAELVETSKLWGRVNAKVLPEWAEEIGAHLVKRSYSEPHWSKKRSAVLAYERVTLYGVPLVADRLVSYGKVDPDLARELFIRHALVYGEWQTHHKFFAANRALLEEVEELEHRARRRDIMVDEHTLFDFYDARVGADVVSGAHFDSWWKKARQTEPDLLTFTPDLVVSDEGQRVSEEDYPTAWPLPGGETLAVTYQFEPGTDRDGVTVDVPLAALDRLQPETFTWQVPGLREELVVALLRSLPKRLRVSFVPAPDHARAFLDAASAGEEPLLDALQRHLRATTGVVVQHEDWAWSKVPAHLRPTFRVLDEHGGELAEGKDLDALRARLRPQVRETIGRAAEDSGLSATGQSAWTFGTIDATFVRSRAGHEVRGYPALVDELPTLGTRTVGLQVLGSEAEQEAVHRRGLRRLLLLALPSPAKQVADELGNAEKLTLAASPYPSVADLLEDCAAAAVDALVDENGGPVRDEAAFDTLVGKVGPGLPDRTGAVLADVLRVLARWQETDRRLSGPADLVLLPALADMKAQVGRLMHRGFISEVGAGQLPQLPRYLQAVQVRLDKLADSPGRDRLAMDRIAAVEEAYLNRVAPLPDARPPEAGLVAVRWMLEELRVSLWAQQLGTPYPVSETRIRKALDAL